MKGGTHHGESGKARTSREATAAKTTPTEDLEASEEAASVDVPAEANLRARPARRALGRTLTRRRIDDR